jgi:rubrerythrin
MSEKFKNQKEALAMAIEMEKKGQEFYKMTAERASDKLTRSVFEFLANEELKHIEAIKNFYDAEIAGTKTDFNGTIGNYSPNSAKRAIKRLFDGLDKKAPADKPDLEAYRFGRDFEKNGEKFYREAAAEATDPQVKKLFEFLIEEEMRHFQMIDDSLAYLEDSGEWFHRMEKWHVEG